MKGIIFNLLDRLATNAGCSDAVWALVADCAVAETRLAGSKPGSLPPGTPSLGSFALSAEALIHCFAVAREGIEAPDVEFEPDPEWAEALATVGPEEPGHGGFGQGAFADDDLGGSDSLLPTDDDD